MKMIDWNEDFTVTVIMTKEKQQKLRDELWKGDFAFNVTANINNNGIVRFDIVCSMEIADILHRIIKYCTK